MLSEYFDMIVCISLPERDDRRAFFEAQAKAMGFKFEYVDGVKVPFGNGKISKERIGCLRAHKNALMLAQEKGATNILIMEDDCQFRNEVGGLFKEGMKSLIDYDLLYLGGTLWNASVKRYNEYFLTGSGILTTHSYCVPFKNYSKLIELMSFETMPVDVILAEFQKENKCLIFNKNITRQLSGYSNIERKFVTSWLFDN
jgi:GR25 family glycosyltransferase involved in LPS biosynthesis